MSAQQRKIKNIESLLLPYLEPGTKIIKQESKLLTAPGENYGSVMLAVDVTIEEPNKPSSVLHLVAKCLPATKLLCDMFNVQETFKREISMYLDVIPVLSKFQEKYVKTERKFSDLFAKCYGGRINLNPESDLVDDDAVLFLENIKITGYDVGDRLVGFDKEHTYRILKDLARFHAVPIAFKILQPNEFNRVIKPVIKGIKIADGIDNDIKQKIIDDIINILKEYKECVPYLEEISKSIDVNLDGNCRMGVDEGPFVTIVHTDYWVNNTMILKDKEDKPIKNKIVDLQMPAYQFCVRDLIFFMYTSIKPEILEDNLDIFIKYYYNCFIECLQEFNIDLNTFHWGKFADEIKNNALSELGHILVMYQPILTKRGFIDDMSNLNIDLMLNLDCVTEDYNERLAGCALSFIKNKWL